MTARTGTGAVSVLSVSVVVRIAGEVDDRLELISVGWIWEARGISNACGETQGPIIEPLRTCGRQAVSTSQRTRFEVKR